MNRRKFSKTLAGATLGTAALALEPLVGTEREFSATPTDGTMARAAAGDNSVETPFKTSVMLWTVFNHLPFEQRLEKVVEAGYHAVELVGEYAKWTEDDFRRYNKKRAELGITYDCTAGTHHGAGDPSVREHAGRLGRLLAGVEGDRQPLAALQKLPRQAIRNEPAPLEDCHAVAQLLNLGQDVGR